jgi:hypothetical protein
MTPAAARCPACGIKLPSTSVFCQACGARFSHPSPDQPVDDDATPRVVTFSSSLRRLAAVLSWLLFAIAAGALTFQVWLGRPHPHSAFGLLLPLLPAGVAAGAAYALRRVSQGREAWLPRGMSITYVMPVDERGPHVLFIAGAASLVALLPCVSLALAK